MMINVALLIMCQLCYISHKKVYNFFPFFILVSVTERATRAPVFYESLKTVHGFSSLIFFFFRVGVGYERQESCLSACLSVYLPVYLTQFLLLIIIISSLCIYLIATRSSLFFYLIVAKSSLCIYLTVTISSLFCI